MTLGQQLNAVLVEARASGIDTKPIESVVMRQMAKLKSREMNVSRQKG